MQGLPLADGMGDFWVFGYGSLMWRPGFAHVETRRARLMGFRRSLCVYSWVHRGTREQPGLVLGLDRGGSCVGMAFRVPEGLAEEVVAYLRERELVTNVYLERRMPVRLDDGRPAQALCYVVDRAHEQYAGHLDEHHAAALVHRSSGVSGRNDDYLFSTLEHMRALGIRDRWMEEVGRLTRHPAGPELFAFPPAAD